MDVVVQFKIEGHERGVNFAIFHPTLPLIASGSDDKSIRIWKYTDSKCNEADCLRGHSNNVSSLVFHPHNDYIISNSEDKTIRVWDLKRKSNVEKVTNENDRYWILASHSTMDIFASGSDSGLTVFKLNNSRIPCVNLQKNILLYNKSGLFLWKFGENEQKKIAEMPNIPNNKNGLRDGIEDLIINPFVNPEQLISAILVDKINKKAINYRFSNEPGKIFNAPNVIDNVINACFISNNKIIALLQSENLAVFDVNNLSNKIIVEIPGISSDKISGIYQGPLGKVIIKLKSNLVGLLDMNTKKISTNEINDFKFVLWNSNMSLGALVGLHNIYIVNKNLEILQKVKENSKINSIKFDENNVLFYTTHFHVKYYLQNGLNGIIKSLDSPKYLMAVSNGTLYFSDMLKEMKTENFNYLNVRFKLSLFNNNYDDVVNILRTSPNIGLKTIEDIKNAGFPDLSLKYVNDPHQKFTLALQSGKLEEAIAAADILKDNIYYEKVAEKAMAIGKLNVKYF